MKIYARTLLSTTAAATLLAFSSPAISQVTPVEDTTFEWIEEDTTNLPEPSEPVGSRSVFDGYPLADAPVNGVPAAGEPLYMTRGGLQMEVPSAPRSEPGPLAGAEKRGITDASVIHPGEIQTGTGSAFRSGGAPLPAPVAAPAAKMQAPAPIAPEIFNEPVVSQPPAPHQAPPVTQALPAPVAAPAPVVRAPAPKAPRRCGLGHTVNSLSGEMAGDDGVLCATQEQPHVHIERRGGEIPGSASGYMSKGDIRRANSLEERRIPVHQVGSRVGQNSPHWSDDSRNPWTEPSGTWTVNHGDLLSNVLRRWAAESGYNIVWDTSNDYMIQSNAALQGTFADAVGEVIQSFANANPPVSAEFYVANKTVVVTTATAYDGR